MTNGSRPLYLYSLRSEKAMKMVVRWKLLISARFNAESYVIWRVLAQVACSWVIVRRRSGSGPGAIRRRQFLRK